MTWQSELWLLPDLNSWNFWASCGHSCSGSIIHLPCVSGTVHHDTPPIKGSIMSTMHPGGLHYEVALQSRNDVVKDDFHKSVSIRPHHLMHSTCNFGIDLSTGVSGRLTKSVERFMKDHPNREALRASQVDDLASSCLSSNKGVA